MTAAPPPASPPSAPPPHEPPRPEPPSSGPPPWEPPSSGPPPWEPPSWEAAPPPPPARRTTLRRSAADRMAGGVAGGLAEYSGIDVLLWRVGFVAFALLGPGVPVYLLLWLLMPSADGAPGPAAQLRGERGAPAAGAVRPAHRSPVPGLTLAALLIVVGLLALLSRLTGWDVGARGFIGTALLVVGLGLVASAFTGRRGARRLIPLGVVLSVALAIASTAPWHVRGGVGDRTYHPLSAAAVQPNYDGGVGKLTIDLGDVDLAGASTPIRTHIDGGVGQLRLILPDSADAQISVDTGLGRVDVLGHGATSGFFPGTGSASWTADAHPEFVVTIDAGIGDVEVSRA